MDLQTLASALEATPVGYGSPPQDRLGGWVRRNGAIFGLLSVLLLCLIAGLLLGHWASGGAGRGTNTSTVKIEGLSGGALGPETIGLYVPGLQLHVAVVKPEHRDHAIAVERYIVGKARRELMIRADPVKHPLDCPRNLAYNLEVGVLISDPSVAAQLEEHVTALMEAGTLVASPAARSPADG